MNADIFSNWLRKQGHQVLRSESSYWYDAGPRVFQAFPYHWLIQPTRQELNRLMLKHGIVALRYSTPLEAPEGMVSYHTVLKYPYNLEMLRSQARNGIRRGLEHCRVECIPFQRLAEEGWNLQQDTLDRQGRSSSMSQAEWTRICLSADGLQGFEAWGAIVEGELAAALLTTRIDDTCYVPFAMSHRKFLNHHVNNALFYVVNCDMLSRKGVSGIFFSLHSLDAPESVDEFKFRMNFIARPVRQCVVFHPLLEPFAGGFTHHIIEQLYQRNPNSRLLAKAEGMLRFHLLGKRSLQEQDWPKCLADLRADLLESVKF